MGIDDHSAAERRGPGRPRDEALAERRREEILRCAMRHFGRLGFESADLDAVAAELGCAKGTLYRYFPSKRELFAEAVDLVMRGLVERVEAAGRGDGGETKDPLERVEAGIVAFLRYFDEHPEYVELLIQERAAFRDRSTPTFATYREVHGKAWLALFEELMQAGRVRRMPPERPFEIVGDLLYGSIFTNAYYGRRKTLREQARDVLDVLMLGLLTPEEAAKRKGERGDGASDRCG